MPVQSVTVTVGPDDVVSDVFVEVNNPHRATGMREVKIVVILPASGEWACLWLLVPDAVRLFVNILFLIGQQVINLVGITFDQVYRLIVDFQHDIAFSAIFFAT